MFSAKNIDIKQKQNRSDISDDRTKMENSPKRKKNILLEFTKMKASLETILFVIENDEILFKVHLFRSFVYIRNDRNNWNWKTKNFKSEIYQKYIYKYPIHPSNNLQLINEISLLKHSTVAIFDLGVLNSFLFLITFGSEQSFTYERRKKIPQIYFQNKNK